MDPVTAKILTQAGIAVGAKLLDTALGGRKRFDRAARRLGERQFAQALEGGRRIQDRAIRDVAAAGGGTSAALAAQDAAMQAVGAMQRDALGRAGDQILRAGMADVAEHNRAVDRRRESIYNMALAAGGLLNRDPVQPTPLDTGPIDAEIGAELSAQLAQGPELDLDLGLQKRDLLPPDIFAAARVPPSPFGNVAQPIPIRGPTRMSDEQFRQRLFNAIQY